MILLYYTTFLVFVLSSALSKPKQEGGEGMWWHEDLVLGLVFALFLGFVMYSDTKRLRRFERKIEEFRKKDIESWEAFWREMEKMGNG